MKTHVLLAIALALLVCAAPVWCQGPPPGGPGGHGGPKGAPSAMMAVVPPPAGAVDGIANALGLTTDQATTLKTILTASDTTIQPLVKTAGDAAKSLHDSLAATTFDATAVAGLAAKAQNAEADVIAASITVWGQIRSGLALTADQLALLQTAPGLGCPPPGGPPAAGSASSGMTPSRRGR